MKALLLGLVSAVLLSACGGAPEGTEETAQPAAALPDPSSSVMTRDRTEGDVEALWTANCAGWDSGGRTCSWKCRSTSEWMWALNSVAYGQCTSYANTFCGHEAYRVCWSSNPHP
ncbi:hypothetical protein JY651_26785 [Pyxidicoccus parkwayensis]|jgi:hypothetical protein|uniref:Lipoprotein n=1 Tax=Pyxidicoccus parkwayensis TaxID=2813578 RepID=A0ABX7NKK6_9BACT|nr:hypothetical protein [Pyxidicoccus parkwaysis]QSQ18958.1 hypothetical protein JY651_26785 [Pyxidicoccus parkwaysis]